MTQTELRFDGKTYDPTLDEERLTGQLLRVFKVMADGKWRTYEQIAEEADVRLSTVGSRIRDLRKPKFGGFDVPARRGDNGLWMYRLVLP